MIFDPYKATTLYIRDLDTNKEYTTMTFMKPAQEPFFLDEWAKRSARDYFRTTHINCKRFEVRYTIGE